jgi:hypothetical protein
MATNAYGNPSPDTPEYDPTQPVYAAPDADFQATGLLAQKPADAYVDPATATVEGRVNNMMSVGNPLLQRAQAQALQTANQRGLLNTRGAALAGTTAMMDKAIDIAKPDAALYGNMAMQGQKSDLDAGLNTQVANYESQKIAQQGRIQGALNTQDWGGKVEIQKMTDNAQLQRVELDNQWKEILNAAQMDTEERKALQQVAASIGTALTGNLERILRDTNIENKAEATEALMTLYRTQMNTAAALLDLEISWA